MATPADSGPSAAAPSQGQKAESKRDRKRQIVLDKIAQLDEEFSRDTNMVYRDQLQKISLEMGLIQRFDPHAPDALDNIAQMRKEYAAAVGPPVPPAEGGRSLLDMAGPTFNEYLDILEDAIEKRDFTLVEHKREHDVKVAKYNQEFTHTIYSALAERDHLTGTIRDRLMNQVISRKNRLIKEKETLELNEASSLLLHPNQFGITNPASPGATHGKRTTRTRRDAEELSSYTDKKRKRNADDDGSPVPAIRTLDHNHTTALWQHDKVRVLAKQNGTPLSVEKLFTDKELSMAHNMSSLSTHQTMLKSRLSPSNADSTPPEESDSAQDGHENGDKGESVPTERHATRSTRSIFDEKNMGPEAVASFEMPSSLKQIYLTEPPKLPPHTTQPYVKPYPRTNEPMTTTSLPIEEINADMTTFSFFKVYNTTHKSSEALDSIRGLRETLEIAAKPVSEERYRLSTQDGPMSSIRSTATRDILANAGGNGAGVNGGVTPSRQSSVGTPMTRQDSNPRARGKGR